MGHLFLITELILRGVANKNKTSCFVLHQEHCIEELHGNNLKAYFLFSITSRMFEL
jgi:hypothetical protein